MLVCAESIINLKGITQKGYFELINPNQNLAVVFEVLAYDKIGLQIEPKRGIILQRQRKKIRVMVKDQYKERALQMNWINQSLIVNCTMKTQYNRKMFQQLNIRGWSKVKDQIQQIRIPITLSPEAANIRSQIQSQATNSISDAFFSRANFSNHSQSRRSLSRKKMSKKLDRQIDYLFERVNTQNQPYKRGGTKYSLENQIIQPIALNQMKRSRPITRNQISNDMRSNMNFPISNISPIRPPQDGDTTNNQKVIQLILLAALAGFFAALGSNIKQIFL